MSTKYRLRITGECKQNLKLCKRMGWTVSEAKSADNLYDPESGAYLNDETMQAIHDVESGNVKRCKDMNELLALI